MERNKEEYSNKNRLKENESRKPYYFMLQILKMKILYLLKFYILLKYYI